MVVHRAGGAAGAKQGKGLLDGRTAAAVGERAYWHKIRYCSESSAEFPIENLDKSAIYPRVCMTAQRCSLEQGGAGAGWAGQPTEALRLGDPSGAGDRCGYLDG